MFGTNFTYDLLVGQFAQQTILELGEQKVYDAIEQGLQVHAALTAEVFSNFADVVTETRPGDARHAVYGGNRILRARKVDQVGVVDVQKVKGGYTVDFPLDRAQFALGWTKDFLEYATAADIAKDFNAARQGDEIDMRNELLNAIFNPTNRTLVESFYDRIAINAKALINADGTEMPIGPRGATFDGSTHNHYLANATLTNAALLSAVNTVKEHYDRGRVYIFINKADEAAVRALTDFKAYLNPTEIAGTANNHIDGRTNDLPLDDREIGEFNNCVVAIKSWMPASYALCVIFGPTIEKIARFRQRKSGLYLAARDEAFPLRAEFLNHDYGCAVYERTAGSVLYFAGGAYTAPVIT